MRRLNKIVSLVLSVCMCLLLLATTANMSGLQITSSAASSLNNELWLLADVNYALMNNKRVQLSAEEDYSPYQISTGAMYMPVSILCEYMGATYKYEGGVCTITDSKGAVYSLENGSVSWTKDGVAGTDFLVPVEEKSGMPFITILMAKDIFGIYNYYDSSMGLTVIAKQSVTSYNGSYNSLKTQISNICSFIMDRPNANTVYQDLMNNAGAATHPRLLADQDTFDRLKDVYYGSGDDVDYKKGVTAQVTAGSSYFNRYFVVNDIGVVEWKSEEAMQIVRQPYYLYDEDGNRLVGQKTYTYTDEETGETVTLTVDGSGYGDGYDVGGRSNVGKFTEQLKSMAFAWQITGDSKFADGFYLLALELDKWEHWGEGHFLNVADGSYAYAIGFDWIYHAYDEEPEKRDELADILYRKGLMMGYYSLRYESIMTRPSSSNYHVSNVIGVSGFRTANRTNNWQTVCGAGMIVSALALAEYDDYRTNCMYVAENYIKNVEKCLIQYAPDGAYPESPGYWTYGTNALMNTVIALELSCGTSYGYTDIVGFHESYYFAAGISNSDYEYWNFHDSGESTIDCSYFYYAAKAFDDNNLAAFRSTMIERGHSMALLDVLYYDPNLETGTAEMPLDNNFKGIHTATFRSSWASGATYTGLHVGPTHQDHADFDTGNFILSMGGVNWCGDPGTEDYNVPGFWNTSEGGTRYKLYRKSLEGHSSIIIHSSELVHGQKYVTNTGTFPVINTFYSDDDGGYAISNMTTQYGSTCTEAYRGVLMTNSRRTVVLQDEISFSSPTSLTWVLNLIGSVKISNDGKSLTSVSWVDGKSTTLRVTMITDDENLKFERLATDKTILSTTITKDNSGNSLACNPEPRVIISAENVTEFNVAVVFEILNHVDEVVGYEKVPMSEWTTCTDEWLNEANSGIVYPEDKPVYKYTASHFVKANNQLKDAYATKDWAKYASIIEETSIYLTDYDPDDSYLYTYVYEYLTLIERYNQEVEKINKLFSDQFFGILPSGDAFK